MSRGQDIDKLINSSAIANKLDKELFKAQIDLKLEELGKKDNIKNKIPAIAKSMRELLEKYKTPGDPENAEGDYELALMAYRAIEKGGLDIINGEFARFKQQMADINAFKDEPTFLDKHPLFSLNNQQDSVFNMKSVLDFFKYCKYKFKGDKSVKKILSDPEINKKENLEKLGSEWLEKLKGLFRKRFKKQLKEQIKKKLNNDATNYPGLVRERMSNKYLSMLALQSVAEIGEPNHLFEENTVSKNGYIITKTDAQKWASDDLNPGTFNALKVLSSKARSKGYVPMLTAGNSQIDGGKHSATSGHGRKEKFDLVLLDTNGKKIEDPVLYYDVMGGRNFWKEVGKPSSDVYGYKTRGKYGGIGIEEDGGLHYDIGVDEDDYQKNIKPKQQGTPDISTAASSDSKNFWQHFASLDVSKLVAFIDPAQFGHIPSRNSAAFTLSALSSHSNRTAYIGDKNLTVFVETGADLDKIGQTVFLALNRINMQQKNELPGFYVG